MDGQKCVLSSKGHLWEDFPEALASPAAPGSAVPGGPGRSSQSFPCSVWSEEGQWEGLSFRSSLGQRGPGEANPSVQERFPCEPGGTREQRSGVDLVPVFQEQACEEEECHWWFYSRTLGVGSPFQESQRGSLPNLQSMELSTGGNGTAALLGAEAFG